MLLTTISLLRVFVMQSNEYFRQFIAVKSWAIKLLDHWINYVGVLTGSATASFAWLTNLNNFVVVLGLVATLLSMYFQLAKHIRQKRRAEQEEILFQLKLKEFKEQCPPKSAVP